MDRLFRFPFVLLYAMFWLLLAGFMSWKSVTNHALLGEPLTYPQALAFALTSCIFWMLSLPVISRLARRYRSSNSHVWLSLLRHAAFAAVFVLLAVGLRMSLDVVAPSLRRVPGDSLQLFRIYLFGSLARNLLLYLVTVVITYAAEFYEDYHAEHAALSELRQRIDELSQAPAPAADPSYVDRFVVRETNRVVTVLVDQIEWIEAAGNYVALHVGLRTFLLRETMRSLVQALDPRQFVRVHRGAIVRVACVRELRRENGKYVVVLLDGTRVAVGELGRDRLDLLVPQQQAPSPLASARG
jgi:DNA-binding LytR/AlgR family response regulator